MRRRIVLASFGGLIACACQPAQSGTEDSSTSVADVPADLPAEEECKDPAVEKELRPADAGWSLEGEEGRVFQTGLSDPDGIILAAYFGFNYIGQNPTEFDLMEVDVSTGEVLATATVPMAQGIGKFVRLPNGDVSNFSGVDGHNITVRRFDEAELVEETQLEDDHPHLGWDGGRSGVTLASANADGYTVVGFSRGAVDPESPADNERRWRKRYPYGTASPSAVEYVWDETEAESLTGSAWLGDDALLAWEGRLERVNPQGATVSKIGWGSPRILSVRGTETILRQVVAPGTDAVELLSWEGEQSPTPVQLWADGGCARQFVHAGGHVRDGEEFVLVGTTGDWPSERTSFILRIDLASGEVLDASSFIQPPDSNYGVTVFEDDGRIGVLFSGSWTPPGEEWYRASAHAVFPFE